MSEWIYKDGPINFDVTDYFGFTYEITNLKNNRKYIGRKYLWSFRKLGKSKRKKKIPSNWKTYYGSCLELKEDIKRLGKKNFRREILEFYKSKVGTNFSETKLLMNHDVLTKKLDNGEYEYYNSNILGRYFRNTIIDMD